MPPDPELLAIRFGYGLPLTEGAPGDAGRALRLFRGPDLAAQAIPAPTTAETAAVVVQAANARAGLRKTRDGAPEQAAYKQARIALRTFKETGLRLTLARAATSPDGLRERMVRFWAGHFAVRAKLGLHGPLTLNLVETAIRPHVAGRFADMLTAVTLHPAMLVYLDQASSVGPDSPFGLRTGRGLNENLAREVMELHSLGSGAPYTQDDVRELAELLTGLTVDRAGMTFRPDWAETGPEVVLGREYAGEGVEPIRTVLGDLAQRPETAAHIARKLAVHFVADDPDAGLVAALTQAFADTGGDLGAVTEALLTHPASADPVLRKARTPFDVMAATLRALQVPADRLVSLAGGQTRRFLMTPLQAMGQPWEAPPGPNGWPEAAEAWISPPGLAARIAWAVAAPQRLAGALPDPVAFARTALAARADERLLWAVARAETVQEGVALTLASPAFNRR